MPLSIHAFAWSACRAEGGVVSVKSEHAASAPGPLRNRLAALRDNDLVHSFLSSRIVVLAGITTAVLILLALFAPWIAPHNPFDLKSINLLDAHDPPAWLSGGDPRFVLGTDDQGRDILSTILFGMRISVLI